MKVLYIGGTGQISFDCVHESVKAGHDTYVFNRGRSNEGLPPQTRFITGDVNDAAAYGQLAKMGFDAVCQFRAYDTDLVQRDLDLFTGHCGQYVFISSASAYQKPMRSHVITEAVPLENPYWLYSRKKAACEELLRGQSALPYTIMRPSHTARTAFPTNFGDGDQHAIRMLAGKPVIIPGDGTNLWTITRSEDFAPPFVKLLGNPRAMNDYFHLTSDNAYMWNEIYYAIARAVGAAEPTLVHVPTDTLVRYNPEWEGPLMGDKTWSVTFDNAKIKAVVGDFRCDTSLDEFMRRSARHFDRRRHTLQENPEHSALLDRIIAEQGRLGR